MNTAICAYCGNSFRPRPGNRNRFCSRLCRDRGLEHPKGGRPLAERFWEKVEQTETCWRWKGARAKAGYGLIWVASVGTRAAHRVAWELTYGPIPEGMAICHHCDVRDCVRPDHLFPGTLADNNADMRAKGRQRARPLPGSQSPLAKLTESQVLDLRSRYAEGESPTRLFTEFQISKPTFYRIIRRQTWVHI